MPKRFQTPDPEPLAAALEVSDARRREIIEGLRDAFLSLDGQWRVTECNARSEAILGKSRDELIGREIWELVGVSPESPLAEVARRVRATGEPAEAEFSLHLNGAKRLLNMRGFRFGEGVAVVSADVTELRRAAHQKAQSEARFRELANGLPAPTWMTRPDGALEYINPAMLDALGMSKEELMGEAWERQVHPEILPSFRKALRKAQTRRTRVTYAVRVKRGDGAWRTLQVTGVPRFGPDGAFNGHVGVATDITDILAAQKRQAILINELNHRVRNTLATVQSIVRQTLKDSPAAKATLDLLNERLMALSAAHDLLTRGNWEGAELTEVARQAVRTFDPDGRRIAIAGPAVRLYPGAALALFMALNELATNAVRHGALSAPEGRVALSWTRGDGGLDIEWRERGDRRSPRRPARAWARGCWARAWPPSSGRPPRWSMPRRA